MELLILCLFFAGVFWLGYIYFCNVECRNIGLGNFTFIDAIRIGFPIAAIVNVLRIAVVFRLNDNDDLPEYLFYISLACLALSYVLFGAFLEDFISNSQKTLTNSFGFGLTVATFFIAVGTLLADRQSWDKSTSFVKARIVLSLAHFTLLLINPAFGILASIIIIPIAMFWPTKSPVIHFE
jgi:hypothetical protein